jgi:hypothetical protein
MELEGLEVLSSKKHHSIKDKKYRRGFWFCPSKKSKKPSDKLKEIEVER